MVIIGVTGGLGTGKSTVARMFARRGAVVLDADRIAHQLLVPSQSEGRRVVKAFGRGILTRSGRIDRAKLAAVVFSDPVRRKQLERIMHPGVMRRMWREVSRLRRAGRMPAVVLDVPLLIEVGAHRKVDVLVVVTAPPAVRRRRMQRQHGWSQEEINARSRAQGKLEAKVALADVVVDNAGGVGATQTQVNRIWKQLVPASSSKSSTSRRSKR